MSLYFLIALVYLASSLILFLTAGIILKENVRSNKNRVVAAMLFWAGLAPFLVAIYNTIIISPEQLSESVHNIFLFWELFFPTLLWFSVLFPEPLPIYSRHRRLLQLAFIPHIFHIILAIFLYEPGRLVSLFNFDTSIPVIGFVLGIMLSFIKLAADFLGLLFSIHIRFFSLVNLAYVVLAVYFLTIGYRRISNPGLRTQVKIVIAGIIAAVGLYVICVIIPTILSLKFPEGIREIMILTALIVGPGSIAWAIIKYRFLDTGLIARQSLVYTISTAIVVGGYLLVITQLSSLFFSAFGLQSKILDILVVVILLLFFQPIYTQVDDFVRRLFIRSRGDYRRLMEEFSKELITVFDINRLSVIVDDTLNKKMFIEKTYFALKQDDESAYRVLSESKEYRLEEEILELILLQPQPVYINNLKRMAREGCLLGRLVELKNHLLVPIIDKGQLLGLIATSAKVAGFRYTYEDITLLSVLANQVVVAINNSRLYAESLEKQRLEEELAVARQIQINLLPKSVPVHERYEFAAFNHPSRQVGGDYYDFIKTADGRICLVVADVSGKGIGAALLGARLQAVLQTEGRRGRPMEILLSGINDFLVESTSSDKFVTMFYGELDCNDDSLCFCNAGHNYPLLLRNDDKIEFLHEGGLILGALPGSQYAKAEVGFGQGDVLVIYTDGISEAFNENGEEFGEERLIETVRKARSKSAQFICGHIIKSVRQFAGHSTEVDDMTLIVLKAL